MAYSIIDTRDVCGALGEVVSSHPTQEAAETALHAMTHRREYINGHYETHKTTAALHHRIRNDATGDWVEFDGMGQGRQSHVNTRGMSDLYTDERRQADAVDWARSLWIAQQE